MCILGVCGLQADAGVTAFSFEEAEFKRFVAQRSRAVITAVTNDKLSMAAPYAVIPIAGLKYAVFEADADEQEVAECVAAGVQAARAAQPRPAGRMKNVDPS